jgi:catalase
MRAAYVGHTEDDDWVQAATPGRDVMDDAARDRLVSNIVGQLLDGVTEPVLQLAFWDLRNVDENLGTRVGKGVRARQEVHQASPVPRK